MGTLQIIGSKEMYLHITQTNIHTLHDVVNTKPDINYIPDRKFSIWITLKFFFVLTFFVVGLFTLP